METKRKLVMSFKTTTDKSASISIDNPKIDITEEEIKTTMELILSKNIFAVDGKDFVSLISAKVTETDTTVYELV
ncbi:DUF2922 domain-containing protein [Metaclostridioides mangenotii]|uniref:DUF2922 domain-containing protein n=1 Tax=Metaclostridioides mangenotii TaxID=1540 RepID=UPI0026F0CD85|nr:DUF2922 domain-containing protein [Clostridioides mangenotii]